MGTYYLFSTRSDGYAGTGYQLDFGYKGPLSAVSFGLQLSYKHFSCGKLTGVSTSAFNQSYLDPYFVCWFDF